MHSFWMILLHLQSNCLHTQEMEKEVEEAAWSLGASPWQTFTQVRREEECEKEGFKTIWCNTLLHPARHTPGL